MDPMRVIYHHEPDGWWAESPDLDGWSAAGATYDEVRALVGPSIRFALDFAGRDTTVTLEHFVPAHA